MINNVIEDNEKEGMCLDYGTFGTYVSANTVQRNGERNRQTDEDLEADFILGLGRLADGSSTAKFFLPQSTSAQLGPKLNPSWLLGA